MRIVKFALGRTTKAKIIFMEEGFVQALAIAVCLLRVSRQTKYRYLGKRYEMVEAFYWSVP
jgi:hypothetical protein